LKFNVSTFFFLNLLKNISNEEFLEKKRKKKEWKNG